MSSKAPSPTLARPSVHTITVDPADPYAARATAVSMAGRIAVCPVSSKLISFLDKLSFVSLIDPLSSYSADYVPLFNKKSKS